MPVRVYLARPSGGRIEEDTHLSIQGLFEYDRRVGNFIQAYRMLGGAAVDFLRNALVRDMLKRKDLTHILFVDSDMQFGPNALQMLVEVERDIVSGLFTNRPANPRQAVEWQVKKRLEEKSYIPHPEVPRTEAGLAEKQLLEVDACGAAFTLISRGVFERLEFPWFRFDYRGEDVIGEDLYFCEKAQPAGFKIWCRLDCVVAHVGKHRYDIRDAWECQAQAEERIAHGHEARDPRGD